MAARHGRSRSSCRGGLSELSNELLVSFTCRVVQSSEISLALVRHRLWRCERQFERLPRDLLCRRRHGTASWLQGWLHRAFPRPLACLAGPADMLQDQLAKPIVRDPAQPLAPLLVDCREGPPRGNQGSHLVQLSEECDPTGSPARPWPLLWPRLVHVRCSLKQEPELVPSFLLSSLPFRFGPLLSGFIRFEVETNNYGRFRTRSDARNESGDACPKRVRRVSNSCPVRGTVFWQLSSRPSGRGRAG